MKINNNTTDKNSSSRKLEKLYEFHRLKGLLVLLQGGTWKFTKISWKT